MLFYITFALFAASLVITQYCILPARGAYQITDEAFISNNFKNQENSNSNMAKCSICSNKIQELFLEKLKGTIVKKEGSNKQYPVCFECQKKFKSKEELLEQIK